jgi:hypothetical protein
MQTAQLDAFSQTQQSTPDQQEILLFVESRWDEFFMLFGAQRPMKTG